jgi:hypothetical protein
LLVVAVDEAPVARLVTVTLAFGSTASEASRTTPVSVARSTCASASAAQHSSAASTTVDR